MNKNEKITYVLFFALLLIGATLRLIHPFNIPFTGDEFNALLRTHFSSFSELIDKGVIIDSHPAGVQVFLYYWTKWFGYSEIAVKLPFILCGILSVFYVFCIGKDWFNPTVGLICAAYIATLQYNVMYSQIARPYSSGLFFTLAMVYYWQKVIFKPENNLARNLVLYILFSALCAYNHYFSLLAATMVGLTGLFFISKKYLLKYTLSGLAIFILYIPHLRIFLYQFGIGGIGKQLAKPQNNFILEYLKYVFHFSPYVYLCVIGLLFFGIITKVRNNLPASPYLLISICWFLIPFLIGFFYSRYINAVLQYSVLIFSFPFLLFCLLGWVPELHGILKIVIVMSLCLVNIISLVYERQHYSIFYKSRYEEVILLSDSVNKKLTPDSCTSLIQAGAELPEYYYARKDKIDTTFFTLIYDSLKKQGLISFIEQQKKPYLSFGCMASPDPVDVAIFMNYYPTLVKQCDFYGGTFYLFSKKASAYTYQPIFASANDFETTQEYWPTSDAAYLSDSISSSGKHSYKMDSLHEWGPAFTCSLNKMISNSHNFINVSIELLPSESLNDVYIASSLESKGKTIDWRATDVTDFIITDKGKKWQKAYHSIRLSDIDLNYPDVVAKIYIWNKGKKSFYMDDFKITTIKGNPIIYGLFEKL